MKPSEKVMTLDSSVHPHPSLLLPINLRRKKANMKEVLREIGKRWKALSDEDRVPFLELAATDKKRYESEKIQDQSMQLMSASRD